MRDTPVAEAEKLVANFALYATLVGFILGLIIMVILLRKAGKPYKLDQETPLPVVPSVLFTILGLPLALFAQGFAALLEQAMGIELGSENTQQIIGIIEQAPIFILVVAVIGPILEEIVFRKVIFGALYERFSFFPAAIISSVIFSVGHMELEHTLLYTAMGLVFSFLYVYTKRIIVPIIAHVAMNTFVVLAQYVFADELEKYMQSVEGFIGGFGF
ncbi:CPBP family intramembrane metalloprotease [Mangrovibacillus cuniculi]|uniref:CPBP family intramembrane metalloprotease n=2 Tax=Mangrovibacillus cuniculi TaxID=2593652 RepID=A0A7S8CEH1_9BACI|nr:CPBP family intramembrane metalloprotease [Mangrovibacillus cuniculi]